MHRLFVALRPPEPVRTRLLALAQGIPGARWQDDGQLHLTLRFVGGVDRHAAEEIALALDRVRHPPLAIGIAGVGSFAARGRPNALWARVVPSPELSALHAAIGGALRRAGVAPDGRAFLPHVTIARLPRTAGPIDRWLADAAALFVDPFIVDTFGLYESELGREGSIYHLAARYPLT